MNPLYAPIKIVLADDHEIFRDGFRSLLQNEPSIELVAEATNGFNLINITRIYNPDVILTDIKMPGMDGIEATRILSEKYPEVPVIALTMFNEDHLLIDMLSAGAKGYLLKDAHKSDIIQAIKTVNRNQSYYCRSTDLRLSRLIANNIFDPLRKERKINLSNREKEVLLLICKQQSNKEISVTLKLSVRTVEGFRKNLLLKTQSRNIAGLVVYAFNHGLFTP